MENRNERIARQRQQKVATCSRCKLEKSWDEFPRDKNRRPFGIGPTCLPCNRLRRAELARKRYWDNPKAARAIQRAKDLKSLGVTVSEYEILHAKQNGLCAICHEPESFIHHRSKKVANLAVDHDHITGEVRGLLCSKCNKGLGLFNDSPEQLQNAIDYLSSRKE